MRDEEALHSTVSLLREFGFEVYAVHVGGDLGIDAMLTVERNNYRQELDVQYKWPLTLANIEQSFNAAHSNSPASRLYVTEWLNEKSAKAFRARGIQYLDMAGNAYLSSDAWTIDVRGRKPDQLVRAVPLDNAAIDPFTPKRAQVIMALLAWPEIVNSPLRELATISGTSLGIAQSTVNALKNQLGWLPRDPQGRRQLVEAWASAYEGNLGRTLRLREFHSAWPPHEIEGLWISGESAVPELLRSERIVAYAVAVDSRLIVQNQWRTDGIPNVFVRLKFWREPHEAAYDYADRRAPWPMIYADLVSSPDPRVRLAGREFLDQIGI